MKKRVLTACAAILIAFAGSGCGKDRIQTELPMKNIRSMMVNGYGDVYLLTDAGIRYYAMSTDKEVDYIYGKDEIDSAELEWTEGEQTITYGSFKIDRLIAAGADGVTMVGRYMTNTSGRDSELFVIQDAADLNFTAAVFREISREEAKLPAINGVGATESAMYYKLNRGDVRSENYNKGARYYYSGQLSPYDVPDGVTGAAEKDGEVYFLVENKAEVKVVREGETVISFERKDVADAFASGEKIYVVYKNGRITEWSADEGEKELKALNTELANVNDSFMYDGQLYWFDKEGIKTAK